MVHSFLLAVCFVRSFVGSFVPLVNYFTLQGPHQVAEKAMTHPSGWSFKNSVSSSVSASSTKLILLMLLVAAAAAAVDDVAAAIPEKGYSCQ